MSYDLFERAKQGDQEAWTELYRLFRPRVAAYARNKIPREIRRVIDADDFAHEILMRFAERASRFHFDSPHGLATLLLLDARRRLMDLWGWSRKEKRDFARICEASADDVDQLSRDRPAWEHTEARETLQRILDAETSDVQRVILRRLEGQTTNEIADAEGCSPRAILYLFQRVEERHFRRCS